MSLNESHENYQVKLVESSIIKDEESLDYKIPVQTVIIKKKNDFKLLFQGFSKMRAVSYVVSPDLLLDFQRNGYDYIEVVVGENLTDSYRQQLSQKPLNVTQELEKLIEEQKLKIFSSKRPIHTKLYILENDEKIRVINGSANFTDTAQKGRQMNYCWYIDFPYHTKQLKQFIVDYEAHKIGCTQFMTDLTQLMRQTEESEKERVIEVWLQSVIKSEESETMKILHETTEKALGISESQTGSPMISISWDSNQKENKMVKKVLSSFDVKETDKSFLIDRANYLNHEKHGIPLMRVDLEKEKVIIGLNGKSFTRTEEPLDKDEIYKALEQLEGYIQTVNLGKAPNSLATKMNMFEALLFIFSAPFVNEYLKLKRINVGKVDLRGPRFAYIYGISHNGKTTFLRYALRLLTGHPILPIPGSELNKGRIMNAAAIGTSFPLIFDDVPQSKWRKGSLIEETIKNYWEIQWNVKYVFPQIIISSNECNIPKWGQTRIKRLEFDVLFSNSMENQKKLNKYISQDNPIFKWFSYLYIDYLKKGQIQTEDELQISRIVMKDLYAFADRPIPDIFPNEPVENIFDIGKLKWHNLIFKYNKVVIENDKDAIYITFDSDMKYGIKEYLGYLPQNIKAVQKGTLVVIQNPEDFIDWLDLDIPSESVFKKIKKAFKRKKYIENRKT